MLPVARIVFFLFAVLMIAGGIAGYAHVNEEGKRSLISLIAGVVCGGLALAGAFTLNSNPRIALILGLVGALLGLGGMLPRVMKSPKLWPGITVVVASAITAVVAGAALAAKK